MLFGHGSGDNRDIRDRSVPVRRYKGYSSHQPSSARQGGYLIPCFCFVWKSLTRISGASSAFGLGDGYLLTHGLARVQPLLCSRDISLWDGGTSVSDLANPEARTALMTPKDQYQVALFSGTNLMDFSWCLRRLLVIPAGACSDARRRLPG